MVPINLVGMALPNDPDPKLAEYAHPERLVTTVWLAEHLGEPGLVVVESDEDVLLYDTGHIPGAVKVDWHTELNDPVTRDYVDGAGFARLCGERGITRDTTVVFYGDHNNWWATYALWVFSLFGHPDVRILDGGRAKWVAEGREMTTEVPKPEPVDYPVVERDDATIRALQGRRARAPRRARWSTSARPASTPASCCTCRTTRRRARSAAGTSRARRASRGPGRRPRTARSRPAPSWRPSTSRSRACRRRDDVIAYCRIGERSSHTWFVLTHLLGFDTVRNYDGSWTEWGNAVRVPIVQGSERGSVPGR